MPVACGPHPTICAGASLSDDHYVIVCANPNWGIQFGKAVLALDPDLCRILVSAPLAVRDGGYKRCQRVIAAQTEKIIYFGHLGISCRHDFVLTATAADFEFEVKGLLGDDVGACDVATDHHAQGKL